MSPMHPTDASARASGVELTEPTDRVRDPLPGQQALWFLHHLTGAGGRYNESHAFALSGAVDERALRGALEALIQRHEALRTALRNDQGRCVAWVEESAPLDFEVVAVGSLDDPALRAVLAGRAREPFDLTHPAPPRVTLFTEAEVDGRGADDRVRTGDLNLGKTPTTAQELRNRVVPSCWVRPVTPIPCSRWDDGWDETVPAQAGAN